MLLSLTNIMFIITLIMGMAISVTSSSWFTAWIGLELNLLSFIPLIAIGNNQYSSEAALKYFLIQALGSSLIIFLTPTLMMTGDHIHSIMVIPLLLKLGAAPFHFWFPQIMEGLYWPQAIILMTIQKIAPMFLISYIVSSQPSFVIIIIVSILSVLFGSIMGLNQTSLRKIMAFSSINHMGWMLMTILVSDTLMLLYFCFYTLISSSVVFIFNQQQSYYYNQLMNTNISSNIKLAMSISLLSLGGLPPFSGFVPKWMVIQELSHMNLLIPLGFMLLATLLTLYFYLRVSVSFLTLSSPKIMSSLVSWKKENIWVPLIIFFNFIGLMFPSMVI
uniref:NADH dehydrogenase subunit 2 n=1 Tax=Emerita talpoida TaxID=101207 RepID=UPI00220DA5EB|nr:NADH dehydrogenase subunit 2 [Emerita talpoida]UXL87263.1 NADH dehydrogenase subunit 2 [Emerita talpoida]